MEYPLAVQHYLADLAVERKTIIEQMLQLIFQIFPTEECELTIAYGMPAIKYQKKPVCYVGNFTKHIGFYPLPETIRHFQKELEQRNWRYSKGAIQLPVAAELDWQLVEQMILYRWQSFQQS